MSTQSTSSVPQHRRSRTCIALKSRGGLPSGHNDGRDGTGIWLRSDVRDAGVGRGGNDLICAGAGADDVEAGAGNDRIWGAGGNDDLEGQSGKDRIYGGKGNDELYGHAGNDLLKGGAGFDEGKGGPGSDTCRQIERRYSC